jgi:CRISPR system Cascade subunit CasA
MTKTKTSNLLTDPVFGMRVGTNQEWVSLPGLLAALGQGQDVILTELQAFQEFAVYSFLVYLGACVLHKSGESDPAKSQKWWRDALEELAGGLQPWSLVDDDLLCPAFLQPPTTDRVLDATKKALTPDDLDMVPCSANHSRKKRLIVAPSPAHWIYALISAQGQAGSVAEYRGTVRATGSGRVYVTLTPSLAMGRQFVRDVAIALDERPNLVRVFGYRNRGGQALPWTQPWTGDEPALGADALDPFFLDIPRLIRLKNENGRVVGYRTETKKHIEIESGTGDLWTPVSTRHSKGLGLTLDKAQFGLTTSYAKVHDLAFEREKTILPASVTHHFEGDGYLIVGGVVTDKGKTLGYHRRVIPVESKHVGEIGGSRLSEFSREHIAVVAGVQKQLNRAVWALILGKTPKGKPPATGQAQHRSIIAAFETEIDRQFFEFLFDRLDESPTGEDEPPTEGKSVRSWSEFVMATARATIEAASRTACHWVGRYHQAMALATTILDAYEAKQRKQDLLFEEGEEEDKDMGPVPTTYDQLHEVINKVHSYVVGLNERDHGSVARLRTMQVETPMEAEFFTIEAKYIDPAKSTLPSVASSEAEANRRWTTIVRLAALSMSLHCGGWPTGKALAQAGLSCLRFERLLNAENKANLDGSMDSTIRFLSSKRVKFNLTDLAYLYLWPKSTEANHIRRRLAKDFYTSSN